jgi:acetoacetyl-CoA synthetase
MPRPKKMWTPSKKRQRDSNLFAFLKFLGTRRDLKFADQHSLYDWSISDPDLFWRAVWDFCGVKSSSPFHKVKDRGEMFPRPTWFPGAKLNFAENLLRFRDEHPAIIFWGENKVRRTITYRELYDEVSKITSALKSFGVKEGDRVAGYIPYIPEAIVGMLATSAIGAVWSSCSPDFGVAGALDRLGQITPKVLFSADGYYYKDQAYPILDKANELKQRIPSIEKVIIAPYTAADQKIPEDFIRYRDLLSTSEISGPLFNQLPFDHPLAILYSSGTTGRPKCIVHGAGGTLLEHLKELILHTDLKRSDRIFYQTTTGWMMWNWHVSSLAAGATLLIYDGAPFHEDGKILWRFAQETGATLFGTNAKFLSATEKGGILPGSEFDLSTLRSILSTGSPLLPESYDFVYNHIHDDVCLSSISGGTDILGCFALGSPLLPVYRGELQCLSLGMKVQALSDDAHPLVGEKGELVCENPFPSQPVSFWNDPKGEKYRGTYFERFPGIWCHGDLIEITKRGTVIFYGRTDATLKPGGIRIGTAEIYRQVEKLPEISESIVIGQEFEGDTRIVLFVKLSSGVLTDELKLKIKRVIRENTTPHHVPKVIVEVPDIPRTKSGKIVELAVRDVIHGRAVKNKESLANPEALDFFVSIRSRLT